MRLRLLLGVLFCGSTWGWAQYPPEVDVTPILKEKRPRLRTAQVAAANCHSTGLPGAQREEVALVKVTVRGPLERSAEHLAAEKAAEIGANCLLILSSQGKDNAEYPVVRSYKAFRVTVAYGPWRVPASVESLASTASAAQPAGFDFPLPKLKMPVIEKKAAAIHGDHLGRAMGEAVYVHEVVLDPEKTDPDIWADVVQDVREYFGEGESEKLARLVEAGKTVRIDLRAGSVSGL